MAGRFGGGADRHRAAEDAPVWIGNHIIEASTALSWDLLDKCFDSSLPPDAHRSVVAKEQQRAIRLNSKAPDGFSLPDLFMMIGRRIVAKQPSSRNIHPVELAFQGVPEGSFADFALIISNHLDIHVSLQPPTSLVHVCQLPQCFSAGFVSKL